MAKRSITAQIAAKVGGEWRYDAATGAWLSVLDSRYVRRCGQIDATGDLAGPCSYYLYGDGEPRVIDIATEMPCLLHPKGNG